MKFKYKFILETTYVALLVSPLLLVAAQSVRNIDDFLVVSMGILRFVINFFMVLATVIFLWGVITYMTAGGEEEKIRSGRTYMLWGIVSLFVMVAVWGLVAVLSSTFSGVNNASGIPQGPQ